MADVKVKDPAVVRSESDARIDSSIGTDAGETTPPDPQNIGSDPQNLFDGAAGQTGAGPWGGAFGGRRAMFMRALAERQATGGQAVPGRWGQAAANGVAPQGRWPGAGAPARAGQAASGVAGPGAWGGATGWGNAGNDPAGTQRPGAAFWRARMLQAMAQNRMGPAASGAGQWPVPPGQRWGQPGPQTAGAPVHPIASGWGRRQAQAGGSMPGTAPASAGQAPGAGPWGPMMMRWAAMQRSFGTQGGGAAGPQAWPSGNWGAARGNWSPGRGWPSAATDGASPDATDTGGESGG